MGPTPLSAQTAVGRLPGLKEPKLVQGPGNVLWLIWLEQRPAGERTDHRNDAPLWRANEPSDRANSSTDQPAQSGA
jgi:hypothetical protein